MTGTAPVTGAGAAEDRLALEDLVTAYAVSLDDRDWEALRGLFTPDAVLDYRRAYGVAAVRDEAVAWLSGQVTRELAPVTQHLVANRRFVPTAAGVEVSADFVNPDVIAGPEGRYLLLNGGRYRFTAVPTADGWRLSRLEAEVLWSHAGELTTFGSADA